MPPIVNDIAFDAEGQAYVTDSLQATIWRYPAGGGAPEIWFQSPLLEGGGFFPFGPNGILVATPCLAVDGTAAARRERDDAPGGNGDLAGGLPERPLAGVAQPDAPRPGRGPGEARVGGGSARPEQTDDPGLAVRSA